MNPPQQGIETAEAISKLRQMQSQIIHGSNIFGDIADLLASIEQENQRLRRLLQVATANLICCQQGMASQRETARNIERFQQALATDTKGGG